MSSLPNGKNLDFTDSGLLKTLTHLTSELTNGNLSNKQKLLISELSIKNLCIEHNMKLENLEMDMLKYTLLGAYIYSQIEDGPFS